MKMVTDINFYPDLTLVRLEDGEVLPVDPVKMTLEELRETLFQVQHGDLYLKECEDD